MSKSFGEGVDRFIKAFGRNLAKEERNAIIEECARELERIGYENCYEHAAAAIRALKDPKPEPFV